MKRTLSLYGEFRGAGERIRASRDGRAFNHTRGNKFLSSGCWLTCRVSVNSSLIGSSWDLTRTGNLSSCFLASVILLQERGQTRARVLTSRKETAGELVEFRVARCCRVELHGPRFSARVFLVDIRHRTQLQLERDDRDFSDPFGSAISCCAF